MSAANDDDVLPTVVPVLRDRWFEPFRAPWRRRALSSLWLGFTLAVMVTVAFDASFLGIGIPALLIGLLLNVTMRNMADAPPDRLDERMVAARNHAFRLAYQGVAVAIVVALGVALALDVGPMTVSRQQLIGIAWCTAVVAMFLPAAILAWTEDVV